VLAGFHPATKTFFKLSFGSLVSNLLHPLKLYNQTL
jgi:hypothetical protein